VPVVSRDPEKIQREIEASRAQLASTLDQLAERTSPKRLAEQAKESAVVFFRSPPGMAVLGAVGLLVALRIARGVRNRRNA
jgi:proteasome assembly chaperone (PAC2) family protein